MKTINKIILAAAAAFSLAACRQDPPYEPETGIQGAVILNNGNWGSNDASIAIYNPTDKTVAAEQFFAANGQRLGDLGQDILVLGDEIYIAMNGSKVVFVTDRDLKIKETIEVENAGAKMAPRYLAESDGKIYVTYYEGFLGEITPSTHKVRTTAVGSYPEGLCIKNGKAYVANSGYGYDNTISVVDLASFKEEKKITVNQNPQYVVADKDGKTLYVCSWDAYDPVTYAVTSPSKLQKVDIASGSVSDMTYSDVKCIVEGPDNKMFVAQGGYDENWQVCGTIKVIDMASGADKGMFTNDQILNYYSLSYSNGFVFVGASDYKTNGDVYLYKADGSLVDKFDSQGLNPQKGLYL